MVEPLISISLLGYIISTDIAENLSRSQIQKQGMDMLDKFIRIQTTDASIIDDIVDTSTPSKLTKGKKLHERGAREECLPLDSNLI
ncbi:hypothetical protein QK905_02820 [Streptococcus thermophilus]|uniref:hypothetical protein n=1 Tax=Streptococcus thermophilus TaxID=1308 RepID=UPI003A7FDAED